MIGLVIVTHGRLAEEFLAAMEHVVGRQRAVEAVCIGAEDDMERRRQDILEAVGRVDDGEGVILLTDMFGGTPSNLAISIMDQTGAEVIAGLNLPMLIKLAAEFDAEVTVTRDGQTVDARSIMGLMMLGAGPGSILELNAEGAEAKAALDALTELVASRFDEDV